MTQEGVDAAAALAEGPCGADKVLVLFLPDCHESLAGIVAGRIRERYHKPTFILTRSEGCVKGSGRSIEAYHMFEALVEVKDLLLKIRRPSYGCGIFSGGGKCGGVSQAAQ